MIEEEYLPRAPDKIFLSRVKGGERGVWVECWLNHGDNYEAVPSFRLQNNRRKDIFSPWKAKRTWNLRDLETLFHILRMDALPWAFRALQGIEEDDGPS